MDPDIKRALKKAQHNQRLYKTFLYLKNIGIVDVLVSLTAMSTALMQAGLTEEEVLVFFSDALGVSTELVEPDKVREFKELCDLYRNPPN